MVLDRQREPLVLKDIPVPDCGPQQVLIRVIACAVCRTDLHVLDAMWHGASLMPEGRVLDREVVLFLQEHLGGNATR